MLEGTKTFKLIRARSKMNNFSAIYKNYFKVKFLQAYVTPIYKIIFITIVSYLLFNCQIN